MDHRNLIQASINITGNLYFWQWNHGNMRYTLLVKSVLDMGFKDSADIAIRMIHNKCNWGISYSNCMFYICYYQGYYN